MKNMENVARVIGRWAFPVTFILIVLWGIATLFWPYGWDQGIFAWIGTIILRGGIPYRDAWDIKGPLTYYIYALIQLLSGKNLWGIRIFDLIFLVCSSYVLVRFVRELTNKTIAKWAGLLVILWYASGSYWHSAQPDGWAAMLMILTMVSLTINQETIPKTNLFLAGVFFGCTLLLKSIYFLFWIPIMVTLFFSSSKNIRGTITKSLLVLAGFLIPLGFCTLWFTMNGALNDFLDVYLVYPIAVYSLGNSTSFEFLSKGMIEYFLGSPVIAVVFPVSILGLFCLYRDKKILAVEMASWILASFLCVFLQGRFFTYHWLVIYPPITILAAIGFHRSLPWNTSIDSESTISTIEPGQVLALILFITVFTHTIIHPIFEVKNWVTYLSGNTNRIEYYSQMGIPAQEYQTAEYIKLRTNYEDRIFIWGMNAAIYYLTDRQSISRFGFSMPFMFGAGTGVQEQYKQEFLSDLANNLPVYIVVAPPNQLEAIGTSNDINKFIEFAILLDTRYELEQQFGDLKLYRLLPVNSALISNG